jgi:putative membrane protein
MWWWMHDGTAAWWVVAMGWAWMIIFWGAIIALVVWVVRRLSQPTSAFTGDRSLPMEIAKARYARGEITREQFEELKKDLRD